MPKKAGTARTGVQRNRAKVQKSFELVRPEVEPQDDMETAEEITAEEVAEEKPRVTPTAGKTATAVKTKTVEKKAVAAEKPTAATTTAEIEEPEEPKSASTTPNKSSAAARMAARRQATQRVQQRNAATLITSEHFAYVKRDLVTIAILASIMFAAIIILYFTIGRG